MRNGFIVGFLGIAIVMSFVALWRSRSPSFGIVDVNALVHHHAKNIKNPLKIRSVAENLQNHLNTWAYTHKILLFSKGSVWRGDLVDYTDQIQAALEKQ